MTSVNYSKESFLAATINLIAGGMGFTMLKRTLTSSMRMTVLLGAAIAVPASSHALSFSVLFGNDGSTGDFTAAQQAAITTGLNTVASSFTDPVTVKLHIMNTTSGLGGSSQNVYTGSYATIRNALIADAKDALDASAVASLGAVNPFGNKSVAITAANARALGFNVPGITVDSKGTFDCDIYLNAGICFTGAPIAGKYDLGAVAMHEADESMGFGGPGSWITSSVPATYVGMEDLFRYKAPGVRTGLVNANGEYFSVDGGVTNIRTFNNHAFGGDSADWATDGNAYVQNAFATPGVSVHYSSKEIAAGDAIGWDVKPTPEPATMTALALGALGLLRRKKKA